MADRTLVGRCMQAHHDAVGWEYVTSHAGMRAVLEHVAAELVVTGHHDAARCLLSQLQAQVIPLRPRGPEDAA